MLAKLAARNVRRSARDYAIYFITVALGVALFYAFNTVSSQAVMLDALSADSQRMLGLLNAMMKLLSIVIVCVLGFLVVYANRFLIRRRRREFGTYLVLGMSAGRVSRILLYETALVGLASLLVGLVAGIALSQGLSFVTAALMGSTMTKYQFMVSGWSILFTAACFLGIFALSAMIDIVYVRRCKLVNLLSAQQRNEGRVAVNVPVRVGAFVAAIALLACAYWQLAENAFVELDEQFALATTLMVVGTVLFFWSVAGFATTVLQRTPRVYFRGLTMFTTRQISSKINTAFASMSVVSILLFFALTITSTGMGLVELFVGNLEQTTRYDQNIRCYPVMLAHDGNEEYARLYAQYDGDMAACLRDQGKGWDDFVASSAQLDYYTVEGVTLAPLVDQVPGVEKMANPDLLDSIRKGDWRVCSVSQYNGLAALIGEPTLSLAADECAVNNMVEGSSEIAEGLCSARAQATVAGYTLQFAYGVGIPIRNGSVVDVGLEIVVPDAVFDSLKSAGQMPESSVLNLAYSVDRAEGDAAFNRYMHGIYPASPQYLDGTLGELPEDQLFSYTVWPCYAAYSGREMADQASGLRMVITYLAVYIGFVLLVATAAILAIQQLSETADSLGRYRRLRDLGADERAILGSLRTQTVTYFVAPLVLAACHTACAVQVVSGALFTELGVNISGAVAAAAGVVVLIYGAYLAVTYALARSIVRS